MFRSDSCGVCQLPDPDTDLIRDHADCNNDCWGSATIDSCGVCHSGNTGRHPNSTMDVCGVCDGDNSTCYGCDGVLNSGHSTDSCGVCGGNDCSCFQLTSLSPTRGPRSGGTQLVISGAGFYRNTSLYNPSLPHCGGVTDSVSLVCQFASSISDDIRTSSSAYIVNQSTIICIAPSLTSSRDTELFHVTIKIDNGPFSNPLLYLYEDYTVSTVIDMSPRRALLGTEVSLNFVGENFLNTSSLVSCLISGFDACSSDGKELMAVPGVYNNGRSVSCSLPPSSSPCQINISLSFDGQLSGAVDTISFNYSYSPPVVNSIHFTDDLTSLIISLDRSSDIKPSINCGSVFSDSTLTLITDHSQCYWSDSNQRMIIVDLSSQATISVGSPVIFREGGIVTRGQSYSYSVPSTVDYTVSSVTNAVRPAIGLVGPQVLSDCASTAIYTVSSYYYHGYGGMTFEWSLFTNDSTVTGFLQLVNILNALPYSTTEVSLPVSLFQPSVDYVLHLNVTNSIGLSTIVTKTLSKSSSTSLEVAITSPPELTIDYNQVSIHESRLVSDSCSISSTSFNYQWRLYIITDTLQHTLQAVSLTDITASSPILHIPPYTLNPDHHYELQLTVSTTGNTLSTSDRVSLYVKPLVCTTNVYGGDRNISSNSVIKLNGTVLHRINNPSLIWSCSVVSSGLPCYNTSHSLPVLISIPSTPQAIVEASHLQAGESYNFTLLDNERHCASSTVIISVYQAESSLPPLAIVQILPLAQPVDVSRQFTIEGLVYSNNEISAYWECVRVTDHGYIDINNSSISPISYDTININSVSMLSSFQAGIIKGRTNRVNLILRSHSLEPGLFYTFKLTATNSTNTISTSVTVLTGSPPIVHQVTVSPSTGVELVTPFTVRVNWTNDNINDQPLYYQYGVMRDGAIYWLTGLTSTNERSLNLPSGVNTLYVRVYDNKGSEYTTSQFNVSVSASSSVNHESLLTDLQSRLADTKDWSQVMSRFVSMLLSIDDTNTLNPDISVSIYSSMISDYSVLVSPQYRSMMISTMKLINMKFQLSSSQKIILLNSLDAILNSALRDVDSNFISTDSESEVDSNGLPLILTSDRINLPPITSSVSTDDIDTIVNELFSYSTTPSLAGRLRSLLLKLSSIICQESHLGGAPVNVTSQSPAGRYILTKTLPFGAHHISSDIIFDLSDSLKSSYDDQCDDTQSHACTDFCVQFVSMASDHFTDSDFISLTSESRDRIMTSIEGVDPDSVKLHSNIINMNLFTATQSPPLSLSSSSTPLQFYVLARSIDDPSSVPVCMYRDTRNANNNLWTISSLSPPNTVLLSSSLYYKCEYTHLTEYAIGLLPPPVIMASSSMILSPSPSPIASSPLPTSAVPTQTPSVTVLTVSDIPAIVSSVVVVLLFIIIGTLLVIGILFLLYKKKRIRRKVLVAPMDEENQPIQQGLVEEKEEKKTEPQVVTADVEIKKKEKGMTLGVIELKGEERQLLGSVTVLHTMRLRELRTLLLQTFPNTLRNKSFYLCTKELSDIDPASEQQQFVNIVYNNIVYIREVTEVSEQTKRQFCVCGSAAQFECSGCGVRGYCSQDCQTKDWNKEGGHQKECQRAAEKIQRTDILIRRQASVLQGIPEERDGEEVPQTSQRNWKGFLSESRKFSTMTLPSVSALPPVNTGGGAGEKRESYTELRNQIDSTLMTPVSARPPLPRLTSTGNISVGRLASGQTPSPGLRATQSQQRQQLIKQGSFTAGGRHTSISPQQPLAPLSIQSPLTSRPSIGSIGLPPVSPTGGQFQWGTLPPHPTAGTQATVDNDNSLFSRPVLPSRTQDLPPSRPPLRRDISISSVGSVDLNTSVNISASGRGGVGIRQQQLPQERSTLREEEEEESESSSESDEEGEMRSDEGSRPPSLAVRRRHSSRQESRDDK